MGLSTLQAHTVIDVLGEGQLVVEEVTSPRNWPGDAARWGGTQASDTMAERIQREPHGLHPLSLGDS